MGRRTRHWSLYSGCGLEGAPSLVTIFRVWVRGRPVLGHYIQGVGGRAPRPWSLYSRCGWEGAPVLGDYIEGVGRDLDEAVEGSVGSRNSPPEPLACGIGGWAGWSGQRTCSTARSKGQCTQQGGRQQVHRAGMHRDRSISACGNSGSLLAAAGNRRGDSQDGYLRERASSGSGWLTKP